jgi:hypothetical protein
MLLKMTETKNGSPNGTIVLSYEKGKEYEIPEKLAKVFITMGCANEVKEVEVKSVGAAPFNKEVNSEWKKKERK